MTDKTYRQTRAAILGDFSASDWLKNSILALDQRDPVDALNDAEALAELAKVRLDAVPGSVGTLSLANGYYCAECGITVICNPDREDMQTKSVLCTGCWLRAGEELRERRMGRGVA
jgi:hypothetical protein